MRLDGLRDWFAEVLADEHKCRLDRQMHATRPPCPDCRKRADILTTAWSIRFVTED